MELRSDRWFRRDDEVGLEHRAAMRAAGNPVDPGHRQPVVGILNSASEMNPCNLPLRRLSDDVRRGIEAAGGIAVELPTISLGEDLMKPTAMLYRNLMAIEVEETIRAHPLDGVVLMGNCDKTIPAQLMGAASADIPALQVSGGYRRPGRFRGQEISAGTDLWKYWDQRRSGALGSEDWRTLEQAMGCTQGACNVMGTALTMAMMAEVLGLMISGASTLPFDDPRLSAKAGESGGRIVRMVHDEIRPSALLTRAAFERAMVALAAIGGSTNAVIHLTAVAGRRMIPLSVEDFGDAATKVPVIADVAPIGAHNIADFDRAGGIQAVLRHLDGDPEAGDGKEAGGTVVRSRQHPVSALPALIALRGNLAPDGAVLKAAAASRRLLTHKGSAVVFDGYEDMLARIDDPDLDVNRDSVLILRGCGPRGGDGFPEWGMIPIPKKLARQGVTDMLRISDARMSGTSYGTCILHVSPEAAVGGPLAVVRDGDLVTLDCDRREIELGLSAAEIRQRTEKLSPWPSLHTRGWPALYQQHVMQACSGADLDFLVPRSIEEVAFIEPAVGRS